MEGHDASKYIMGVAGAPPLVGESADMKLAQKMMSEVSVIVIVVAAIGIVTGLPVGLPYHEFLSIAYAAANFAIFTLGMGLLVLFILFPQVPLSVFVAKKLVGVAAGLDHLSLSLKSKFIAMRAAGAPPLVGESADMKLAQKMSEVLVIVIVIAAIGIVTGLSVGLPHHEFFSIAYAAANFAIFTLGMGLLVLFIVFPQVPLSVFVAKKLVGVAAGLDHLSLSLKSKFITMRAAGTRPSVGEAQKGMFMVPFLVIMAAAIGIVSDLPVGLPHHEILSIAYAVVNFITFTLGMAFLFLYILFPQVPLSFVVVAGAPPWDAPPWAGDLADVKPVQKRMFKVSLLAITITSIVIVADLPVDLPRHELLSIVYILATSATFAFGVVLLLLSILFPPFPISAVAAKKLIWVALGLVCFCLGLGMAIHAIS